MKENLEETYVAKLEREMREKLREQYAAEEAAVERTTRKAAHGGKCGHCGGDLEVKVFRGLEIDVCKWCGSVLLDAGELETLAGHDQTSGLFAGLRSLFGSGE